MKTRASRHRSKPASRKEIEVGGFPDPELTFACVAHQTRNINGLASTRQTSDRLARSCLAFGGQSHRASLTKAPCREVNIPTHHKCLSFNGHGRAANFSHAQMRALLFYIRYLCLYADIVLALKSVLLQASSLP